MENAGPESRGTDCAVSGYGKRGFERNYDSDMRTFRNCDFKRFETETGDIRCNEISTLTVNYVCIISHIMYVTNQIQKAFTEWNKHKIIHSSV